MKQHLKEKNFILSALATFLVASLPLAHAQSDLNDDDTRALIEAEAALLKQLEQSASKGAKPAEVVVGEIVDNVNREPARVAPTSLQIAAPGQNSQESSYSPPAKESAPDSSVSTKNSVSLTRLQNENESLHGRLKNQETSLNKLQRTRASLESQLSEAKRKIESLSRELDEAQGRLLLAETEVQRLSRVIEVRGMQTPSSSGAPVTKAALRQDDIPNRGMPEGDMMIATVVADKANLRTGPGLDNSPLMTVAKGTRLAIETREGSWYRVISPSGARAWVASEVISFGSKPSASPSRTVRVGGIKGEAEDDAFYHLKRMSR